MLATVWGGARVLNLNFSVQLRRRGRRYSARSAVSGSTFVARRAGSSVFGRVGLLATCSPLLDARYCLGRGSGLELKLFSSTAPAWPALLGAERGERVDFCSAQ